MKSAQPPSSRDRTEIALNVLAGPTPGDALTTPDDAESNDSRRKPMPMSTGDCADAHVRRLKKNT